MIAATAESSSKAQLGALLEIRFAAYGSAAHPYFASPALLRGEHGPRNLADAVHFLCALHGLHPGIVDHALRRTDEPEAHAWLARAAEGFAAERRLLASLAVAVGPAPGTPGGSASEVAVAAQRAALGTLAGSERRGCALGAAIALVADWRSIRCVLDIAARRLGVEPPELALPGWDDILALVDSLAGAPPYERALLFGAEQTFIQHHGLWSLLEARERARRGA